MIPTYEEFLEKAELYCYEKSINTEKYNGSNERTILHLEMLKLVKSYFPMDIKSVKKATELCNQYEKRFWNEHIK